LKTKAQNNLRILEIIYKGAQDIQFDTAANHTQVFHPNWRPPNAGNAILYTSYFLAFA
jgi:hypothetical protein